MKSLLPLIRKHNSGVIKTTNLHDKCSNHQRENISSIVTCADMILLQHCIILQMVDGVLIVQINNYAKMYSVSHVLTILLHHMKKHNFGVRKMEIYYLDRCSNPPIKSIGLIVISVLMTFTLHCTISQDKVVGVLIVQVSNYVKMYNVNHVMTNHLPHMKKHNSGVRKMEMSRHDKCSNQLLKSIGLIVTSALTTFALH